MKTAERSGAVCRIGCSGFSYDHWRGTFYPGDLSRSGWFGYYCTVFRSVELNVTFYRLPKPETLRNWFAASPPDFVFSAKGSRFITHVKRLGEPEDAVRVFFDHLLHLGNKLKVVLWQFPPAFRIERERLRRFLDLLRPYPVRNAFEFRHESWLAEDVIDLCRRENAALCMADWPAFLDDVPVTADFVYIRRHGTGGDPASCYPPAALGEDALRIRRHLEDGRDVFMYFNNDAMGFAPGNAAELMALL